jgi:hypothetical protein
MTPDRLQAENFRSYPPQARETAVRHLDLLRRLPLGFVPLLLREVIAYDYKFPVEQRELDHQFAYLQAMSAQQLQQTMRPFAQLHISSEVERLDWIGVPADFSEQLTAHLWTTHQIDAFRAAAVEYVDRLNAARPEDRLPSHRLGIVVLGQGVTSNDYPLFRKLRPHGVHYRAVDPAGGFELILRALARRAAAHPARFSHWHIEGGGLESAPLGVTVVSYAALRPVRAALQMRIQQAYESGMGSEALRTTLARTRPEDLGLQGTGDVATLNRFQMSLLTEGSGTQIFATTFVQWAAREVWRRAQPLTLSARFTPRQKQDSSRELFSETRRRPELDPLGSLVDADMGSYYTWVNQQRLPGASEARFLVWFEGHNEALAIAPGIGRGKESKDPIRLSNLIDDLI